MTKITLLELEKLKQLRKEQLAQYQFVNTNTRTPPTKEKNVWLLAAILIVKMSIIYVGFLSFIFFTAKVLKIWMP